MPNTAGTRIRPIDAKTGMKIMVEGWRSVYEVIADADWEYHPGPSPLPEQVRIPVTLGFSESRIIVDQRKEVFVVG